MFNLDEKYFMNPCNPDEPPHFTGHFPREKPSFTMTEEMNATMVEMRATIDRLLRFEQRVEGKASDLMRKITSDNVIFKNTFAEAYNTFLHEVKNEINMFEGNVDNSIILFTKDIETKFSTIVDDNNRANAENLKNFTAKLDEAIAYMKTNIGATVGNIIGEMRESGELNDIIEGEVVPELAEKISATKQDFFSVNNSNLANAVKICKEKHKVFYVPYGETLIINKTLDLKGIDLQICGTLQVTHNGVGVVIGDNSLRTSNIYIRDVVAPNYVDGDISVRVVGVKRGRITIDNAPTIQLYANGDVDGEGSIAYSVFNVLSCRKLMLYDEPETVNFGWINENTFHVERITEELSIIGNTYQHNNNVFYKPCVEGGKITFKNCRRNKIYDLRNEGMKSINLDSNTWQNEIVYNYHTTIPYNRGTFTDEGRDNVVECSVWRNNRYIPVRCITPKSIEKGFYEIADNGSFTVNDDSITPTTTYANVIENLIIPAKYINRIRATSDTGCIRIRVALLDASLNPITEGGVFGGQVCSKPVYYYGVNETKLVIDDNGMYDPQTSAVAQTVDILNKNAEYIKITVQSAERMDSFKYLTLLVGCNERDSAHLEYLKYNIMQ